MKQLSSVLNGQNFHCIIIYIAIHVYIFQVDCHSVNVLCVSKYPPNVKFCNASINTQHVIKRNDPINNYW